VLDADPMLTRIRDSAVAAELLAGLCDFDVGRDRPLEDLRLASGDDIDVIAGDAAGGCYLICGTGPSRPVVFATSEGQAGLIAADLAAALEMMVTLPYWLDCLKFSAGGQLAEMQLASARLEREFLEDFPDLRHQQAGLRHELDLSQRPAGQVLARLRASVASTQPAFILLGQNGGRCKSLFGTFRVSDNPAWR
jgi:hypothetical protein